jgi:hypothetical protein
MIKNNGAVSFCYRIYVRKGKELYLDGKFKYDVYDSIESAEKDMITKGEFMVPYVIIKEYSIFSHME